MNIQDFSVLFSGRLDKYKSIYAKANVYGFRIYLYIGSDKSIDKYEENLISFITEMNGYFTDCEFNYFYYQSVGNLKKKNYTNEELKKVIKASMKKALTTTFIYEPKSEDDTKRLMLVVSPTFAEDKISGGYIHIDLDMNFLSQWSKTNEFIEEFIEIIGKYNLFENFIISPAYLGSLGSSAYVDKEQKELQDEGSNLLFELSDISNYDGFNYLFWVNGFNKKNIVNIESFKNNSLIEIRETKEFIVLITKEIVLHKGNTNNQDFQEVRNKLEFIYKNYKK